MAFCSVAQAESSSSIQEALKDIKPAGSACLADDVVPDKFSPGNKSINTMPDMSCAISSVELPLLQGHPETLFVDVRTAAEYEAYRIDSALNMTVSALRSKSFMREKSVVLIGNGKAERELYGACGELKKQGFKQIRVLQGGMSAWLFSKQPVVGRPSDAAQYIRLSPAELWTESQFDANLVLVVPSQKSIQRQLVLSLLLPDENVGAIKSLIDRRRKEKKILPLAAVVLVSTPGIGVDYIHRLQEAIQPMPLLVYADTEEAYVRQLAQQKAVWAAYAHGPKQPGCSR